jgi:hypothetical protein
MPDELTPEEHEHLANSPADSAQEVEGVDLSEQGQTAAMEQDQEGGN